MKICILAYFTQCIGHISSSNIFLKSRTRKKNLSNFMRLLDLFITLYSGLAKRELISKKNCNDKWICFYLECGVNEFLKYDSCLPCGANSHNGTNSTTCSCDKNDKLGLAYFRHLHQEQNWDKDCFCMSNFR